MVWAGGWSDAEVERAVSSAARIGYDILEIPVMNPDEFDAVHTKALLDKHNFLASDASSLLTGSIVVADAGYTCW